MKKKEKPSLLYWILLSVVLGIAAGLFFGEWCTHLEVVGQGFIALMQISVLPYILCSLIHSIGGLEPGQTWTFARRGLIMLGTLWIVLFALMALVPLCFPDWSFASFFSPNLLEGDNRVNYINLFIPSNPFNSLANNIVPAVMVFSILSGVALMNVPGKQNVLNLLGTSTEALTRLNQMLMKLSPFGIFALVADVTGDMHLEEAGRLEIYLISYFVMGLLLFFLILPLLLTAFTPFRYLEIMRISRTAMLTVLLTGNVFIVLPLLVENIDNLLSLKGLKSEKADQLVKIMVPIVFILPCVGQLMDLFFILFAGWFSDVSFSLVDYIKLYGVGSLTTFGRAAVAIPLLLDMFKLSSDLIELFTISSVITDNIRFAVEAFTIFAFSAFLVAWTTGALHFRWRKIIHNLLLVVGITAVSLLGLKWLFLHTPEPESKRNVLEAMTVKALVPFQVFDRLPDSSAPCEGSRLDQLQRTGVLRVGFNGDTIPFSFFNHRKDLIGFDINMAHKLAAELGCRKLEFYPVHFGDLATPLNENKVDIIMCGVSLSKERLGKISFTDHYLEMSTALLLPDYLKNKMRNDPGLIHRITIAAAEGADYQRLTEIFPESEKLKIHLHSDFFAKETKADALFISAENGSIWTILHPEYALYIPPGQYRDLVAYAVANNDTRFLEYLDYWLTLKQLNGEIAREYDYWIKGIDVKPRPRRWSVLNNLILKNN